MLVAALSVVGGLLAPAVADASAGPYPPTTGCAVSTSATAVAPGATLTIMGSGFTANEMVHLSIAGIPLGTVRTTADGSFVTSVTITSSLGANYHIVASSASATCSFDPTPANPSGDRSHRETSSTASTGVPTAAVVSIAVILLGSGVALAVIGRRRRLG